MHTENSFLEVLMLVWASFFYIFCSKFHILFFLLQSMTFEGAIYWALQEHLELIFHNVNIEKDKRKIKRKGAYQNAN